jgi:hypothetical protein
MYDILKTICDSKFNYFYTLNVEVFENWKNIVLTEITPNSIINDFLIPNKNNDYLDILDYNSFSTLTKDDPDCDYSMLHGVYDKLFTEKQMDKNLTYKQYNLFDFILEMFNKLNYPITSYTKDNENKIYNEYFDIQEFYYLYNILKTTDLSTKEEDMNDQISENIKNTSPIYNNETGTQINIIDITSLL